MKLFLTILISCVLAFSQVVTKDSTYIYNIGLVDTISVEEQFLNDIAEKALEKEAKKQKLTNDILIIIIIGLLIDDFF